MPRKKRQKKKKRTNKSHAKKRDDGIKIIPGESYTQQKKQKLKSSSNKPLNEQLQQAHKEALEEEKHKKKTEPKEFEILHSPTKPPDKPANWMAKQKPASQGSGGIVDNRQRTREHKTPSEHRQPKKTVRALTNGEKKFNSQSNMANSGSGYLRVGTGHNSRIYTTKELDNILGHGEQYIYNFHPGLNVEFNWYKYFTKQGGQELGFDSFVEFVKMKTAGHI